MKVYVANKGLPWWFSGKESTSNAGEVDSIPESGRFPWRRKGQPALVFLPEESYRQRSLAGTIHKVAKNQTRLGMHPCGPSP